MNFINQAYGHLEDLALAYTDSYASAMPYPNISFRNFFNENMLSEVLAEFRNLDTKYTNKFNTPNESRFSSNDESQMGPKTKQFIYFLNSAPFISFLQKISGIEEILLPDPYLESAGLHQVKQGGYLKIHADYNKHRLTKLDKRLNVLIYLNKKWQLDYGGHFELWDTDMSHCVKQIFADFNTLIIFSTTDSSFHGFPDPITCPPDNSRKSLSLYYYSNGRPAHEINEGIGEYTPIFKARKGNMGDTKMKMYNAGQTVTDWVKEITPPVITKLVQKVIG
jgi:Rps23 Pro-64 3,4-dihydroxylase Tpa1-like proline 4-hydroxylase